MTVKTLIKVGKSLGLEPYNKELHHVCFHGINGGAAIFHDGMEKLWPASTMLDFAEFLKVIGRDELRMEMNSLLSITRHL